MGLIMGQMAWAQDAHMVSGHPDLTEALQAPDRSFMEMPSTGIPSGRVSTRPVGTRVTGNITATKIGEAPNGFTMLSTNVQPLTYLPSQNFISAIYRQDPTNCGGASGQYRYSYSDDGGATWQDASVGIGSCYGYGVLNVDATNAAGSRYPSMAPFMPAGGTTLADLKMVFTGRVSAGGFWTGSVAGVVSDPTNFVNTATNVTQESYPMDNTDDFGSGTFAERVPGEYWLLSPVSSTDPNTDGNMNLWKGIYSNATQQVNWSVAATLDPNHLDPANWVIVSPMVAFGPSGMSGIAVWSGDLASNTGVYGSDSTLSIVYSETSDGGNTWGPVEEIDMMSFDNLRDSLQSFWITTDTTNNDSVIPASSGVPTTGFDLDVTVDANGNAHIFVLMGSAQFNNQDGTTTELGVYSIYSGLRKFMYDFTRDQTGKWNGIYVGSAATFRGSFGAGPDISIDPYMNVSRSEDGTKIFYSYTDTDTTGNFGSSTNSFPNLIGRALNINTGMMTADSLWTAGDPNFDGVVYTPNASPIAIDNGDGTFGVPYAFLGFTDPLATTDVWYTNLKYDTTDMNQPIQYLDLCAATDLQVSSLTTNAPTCGASDGALSVDGQNGTAPYNFLWDGPGVAGNASANISGLAAGTYTVTITDDNGCSAQQTFVLESVGAATLAIADENDISCNGFDDGTAAVVPTGGTAPFSFSWDNGETDSVATMLPVGTTGVTVTDATGCISFAEVTIEEPSAIDIIAVLDGTTTCFGDADGEVYAEAIGGTGTLSYEWAGAFTGQTYTGLDSGTYTVSVTDENGCITTADATVSYPPAMAITGSELLPNTDPNGGDGGLNIDFTSTGNGVPYTIVARLIEVNGNVQDTVLVNTTSNNTSDEQLLFLCGGTYELTVSDANGCAGVDTAIVSGEPCFFAVSNVSDAGLESLNVFPNPTNGMVEVELSMNEARSLKLEIFNAQGQLIMGQNEELTTNFRTRFNLSEQPAGIYLLRVSTPKGVETRQIMLR